jgi:peptidoglycan/LPS O-acetylase OafA/YrhL
MNADASSGVAADVAVGATFPGLALVVGAMAALAVCLLVLAIILMVAALRARTRRPPARAGAR